VWGFPSICQGYLERGKKLKDIPIVWDYLDVFHEKLPGLPPKREA
jgi:hypothetical protein